MCSMLSVSGYTQLAGGRAVAIPEKDPKILNLMINALEKAPQSIEVLMRKTKMSRRTIYRYLDQIEFDGYNVEHIGRSRPTLYQIV